MWVTVNLICNINFLPLDGNLRRRYYLKLYYGKALYVTDYDNTHQVSVSPYNERSNVERVNGRLKDEFGGRMVRVRGDAKVMTHLMFGNLVLTADQYTQYNQINLNVISQTTL